MLGISIHPVEALDGESFRMSRDRAVEDHASGELRSRRLRGEVVQERLSLFPWKEFEEAYDRLQKNLRVTLLNVCPG
jgi:hypothetical protein